MQSSRRTVNLRAVSRVDPVVIVAIRPLPTFRRIPISPLTRPSPDCRTQVDRFIPSRSALDLDIAHYNLVKENANSNDLDLAAEVTSPSKVRPPRPRFRRRHSSQEESDARAPMRFLLPPA